MKRLTFLTSLLAFGFLLSHASFANEPTEGTTEEAAAEETKTDAATTVHNETGGTEKKMTKKEARTACKKEGLKGKELRNCIKEKTGA